jgi:acetylornithine deacetylase/succinyl-diaminopimelate desuccinylase-like protein
MPVTPSLLRRAALAGGLTLALPPLPLGAQAVRKDAAGKAAAGAQPPAADPARTLRNAAVRKAVDTIRATNAWTLDQQVSICEIPAPPFKEQARGQEMKRRFEALGLRSVRIDAEGNVLGERPGTRQDAPIVVLQGHLDTVFPEGTDVRVKRDSAADGPRLTAPGIGDDCRGLAVVLATARALQAANVKTDGTIIFVADVGEEGPGNLRGTRRLFDETLKGQIDYFVAVDGTGLGTTSRAVGSSRYRVTYKGPGGHSYGAFGMPNPIHALGRAIAKIGDLQVPASPKTTFNVGIVEGGQTVNSISASASMDVDMRSESAESLADVERRFRAALDAALAEEKARWPNSRVPLTLEVTEIGKRPAGGQPDSAPIVRAALAAAQALGFTSSTDASSTDSNYPISLGIPAITIDGGGRGFGAHALSERYEDGPRGWLGPQWAALIVTSLAGVR